MNISRISCQQAKDKIDQGACQLVDIRDPMSFAQYHIDGCAHLDNDTIPAFLEQADKTQPLLVFCYHGNSSQQAAGFFIQQGFSDVHSVDGGMEMWRTQYPETLA